jgi:hypothetical protein
MKKATKATKPKASARDLKPKKNAKGGMMNLKVKL